MRSRQKEKYQNWCSWYMRLAKYQERTRQSTGTPLPQGINTLYGRRRIRSIPPDPVMCDNLPF